MQTIASTQQNIDTIQSLYDAFGRGDVDFILSNLTDDVRWTVHGVAEMPWSGDFSGRQNVRRFFDAIYQNCEVLGFEALKFIAEGDSVVTLGTFSCKFNGTGKTGTTRWSFIWQLRDGKVSSYEQFVEAQFGDIFRA